MPKISILLQYFCFIVFIALVVLILFFNRPIGLLEITALCLSPLGGLLGWAFNDMTSKKESDGKE